MRESIRLKGRDQALLMLHGFSGSARQLADFGKAFHERFSWQVDIPLLPGHGSRPKDLVGITYQQWQDQVELTMTALLREFQHVHLLGLSMGALLCLDYFQRHKQNVASMALLAPALTLNGRVHQVLFALLGRLPPLPFDRMILKDLDPQHPIPDTYDRYPLSGIQQVAKLARKVRHRLPLSVPPTCVAYSRADETVGLPAILNLHHDLVQPNLKRIELTRSHHVLPLAQEKDYLLAELIHFYEDLPPAT